LNQLILFLAGQKKNGKQSMSDSVSEHAEEAKVSGEGRGSGLSSLRRQALSFVAEQKEGQARQAGQSQNQNQIETPRQGQEERFVACSVLTPFTFSLLLRRRK
jgi:hypothetical protein